LLPPKDSIYKALDEHLPKLKEGDVVFITSKILAIHQGRTIKIGEVSKKKIIYSEAEKVAEGPTYKGQKFYLTIKDYTLIPSAGIDESNGNGYYILWPKNTQKLLKEIWLYLKKKYKLKNLGVVSTDSHTTPLRWGVTGISTGFFGFKPLKDMRGKKDIFGRKLKATQVNLVDGYSSAAVVLMGEGNEQVPIVILRGAKNLQFTNKDTYKDLVIEPKNDIYRSFFKHFRKA
jgi:F420-0:gamma-glutamyl ligase